MSGGIFGRDEEAYALGEIRDAQSRIETKLDDLSEKFGDFRSRDAWRKAHMNIWADGETRNTLKKRAAKLPEDQAAEGKRVYKGKGKSPTMVIVDDPLAEEQLSKRQKELKDAYFETLNLIARAGAAPVPRSDEAGGGDEDKEGLARQGYEFGDLSGPKIGIDKDQLSGVEPWDTVKMQPGIFEEVPKHLLPPTAADEVLEVLRRVAILAVGAALGGVIALALLGGMA